MAVRAYATTSASASCSHSRSTTASGRRAAEPAGLRQPGARLVDVAEPERGAGEHDLHLDHVPRGEVREPLEERGGLAQRRRWPPRPGRAARARAPRPPAPGRSSGSARARSGVTWERARVVSRAASSQSLSSSATSASCDRHSAWICGAGTAARRAPSSSRRRASVAVAAQMLGDAREQAAERLARAVRGEQRGRVRGVGAHAREAVAAQRGAQGGDAAADLVAPRRPRRDAAARSQCSARSPWPYASCMPAAASARRGWAATCASVKRVSQCSTVRARALLERASADRPRRGRRRVRPRPRRGRAAARRSRSPAPRVPGARAAVQRGLELRLGPVQLGAQHVAEQAVMAVALARCGRAPRAGSSSAAGDASVRGASRTARGPRRRAARSARRGSRSAGRTAASSADRPASTSSRRYSATSRSPPPKRASAAPGTAWSPSERAASASAAGQPSVRVQEHVEVVAVELQAGDPEQRGRFGPRHRQLGEPELGDEALGPQPRHRQRRLGARREHDRHALGRLRGERGDRLARGVRGAARGRRRGPARRARRGALAVASSTARATDRSRNARIVVPARPASPTRTAAGRAHTTRTAASSSRTRRARPRRRTAVRRRRGSASTRRGRRTVARSRGRRGTSAPNGMLRRLGVLDGASTGPSSCRQHPRRLEGRQGRAQVECRGVSYTPARGRCRPPRPRPADRRTRPDQRSALVDQAAEHGGGDQHGRDDEQPA